MRPRLVALQIWMAVSLFWALACGVLAGSGWLEAQLGDAVRLQQQARDVRAAGMEPVALVSGGPIAVGGFTVPPVRLDAAGFWAREGLGYERLALAPPAGLLLLMAGLDAAVGALRWRRRRGPARAKPLAFPRLAASLAACSTAPLSAASSSD